MESGEADSSAAARRFARLATLGAAALPLAAMIDRVLGLGAAPGPPMVEVTALTLLAASLGVWTSIDRPSPEPPLGAPLALGLIVSASGAFALIAYLAGVGLTASLPSPHTGVSLLFIGAAIACNHARPKAALPPSQWLAIASLFVATLALSGHLYGFTPLFQLHAVAGMALPTALAVALLCAGLFASRPSTGVFCFLAGEGAGSWLLRRLMPVALLLPWAAELLAHLGARAGLWSASAVRPASMLFGMFAIVGVAFGLALALNRVDARRGAVEATLRAHQLHLEEIVVERTREIAVSELRYRGLVERAPDCIFTVDHEQRVQLTNEAAERLFGMKREQLIGCEVGQLLTPATDGGAGTLAEVAARAARGVVAMNVKGAKGELIEVEVSVAADASAAEPLTTLIVRDVSERKRGEAQMRVQSTALGSAHNAIVITGTDGLIHWVNPAFTRLTGYEAEEVLGKNPRVLKSGSHDRDLYAGLWDSILAGRVWFGEMVNRRKDGTLYTEEQTITPVTDASGAITHFIAIKHDVTARREADAERERMLGELRAAADNIRTLSGLLPICSWCKKIRDDSGYWNLIEAYISKHTDTQFTHGVCPECFEKHYAE